MGKRRFKLSLTAQIAVGLGLGVVVGFLLREQSQIAIEYIKPVGAVYLNLIKTIVVPVVTLSVIQGIISLQDIRKVGAIGIKTVAFYLVTTAFAVALGLLFANLFNVAGGYRMPAVIQTVEPGEPVDFLDTVIGIVPSNILTPFTEASMLQVIVVALLVGFGMILAGEKGKAASRVVDSFAEVFFRIMDMIIRLSPIGVFALICPVVANQGIDVLLPLLRLVGIAYLVYAIHILLIYSASIRFLAGVRPMRFFKEMSRPAVFAFSSASSVGTLPLNLEATKNLGVSREISSFVLPLGATINMDGTAIYQGVCAVFIAQVYQIDLTFSQQLMIILTAVLASIGTAGVPSAGVIMLSMVLQSAGLPLEGIGLVYGIDRILDMGRTVVNITGDAACAVCINAWEAKVRDKNPGV